MERISCIYSITNTHNNKMYIGYSANYEYRKKQHINALILNKHKNEHLQSAWNKYGESSFSFEVLEEYPIEFLPAMENWWCNMLSVHDRNFGYNIDPTSPFCGNMLSLETKKKISFSKKGKKFSEEHKAKLSASKAGKPWTEKQRKNANRKKWTEERRENARKNRIGKKLSEETKIKISIANKGKIRTEDQKSKMSRIKTGTKHTRESIEMISKALRDRIWSEESKNKISSLKKEWHRNKKENSLPYTKHNRRHDF